LYLLYLIRVRPFSVENYGNKGSFGAFCRIGSCPEVLYHNTDMNEHWPENPDRLNAVRLADPGLYALGLHAFIESHTQGFVRNTRYMNFRDYKESIPSWTVGELM